MEDKGGNYDSTTRWNHLLDSCLAGNLILGLIGAFVGGFLFGLLGIQGNAGFLGSIVVATIGSVILIWLSRFLVSKR